MSLTIFASFLQLNFDLDRGVFPVVIQAVVDEGDGEHCWSFLILFFKCVGPVGEEVGSFFTSHQKASFGNGRCLPHPTERLVMVALPCGHLKREG